MSTTVAYRDQLEAARLRLAALDAEVARREAAATPVFWSYLPHDLAHALRAARPGSARVTGGRLDAVLAAQAARESYLALLDRALGMLPELEARWHALPGTAPRGDGGLLAWFDVAPHLRRACERWWEAVRVALRRLGAAPREAAWGDAARRFEGQLFDAPVALLVGPSRLDGAPCIAAGTSVRPSTAHLRVAPEGITDAVMTALNIRRDARIGDEAFDGYFLVRGDGAVARTLLSGEARAAMLRIAQEDVPTLDVSPRGAWLWWSFEPSVATVEAAARAVVAVRNAPPTVALRR